MKYKVLIRNNTTGEERIHDEHCDDQYRDTQPFYWEEGNGSCDCNREAAFTGEDYGVDMLCGDKRFTVPWIEFEDGERVPIDTRTNQTG